MCVRNVTLFIAITGISSGKCVIIIDIITMHMISKMMVRIRKCYDCARCPYYSCGFYHVENARDSQLLSARVSLRPSMASESCTSIV